MEKIYKDLPVFFYVSILFIIGSILFLIDIISIITGLEFYGGREAGILFISIIFIALSIIFSQLYIFTYIINDEHLIFKRLIPFNIVKIKIKDIENISHKINPFIPIGIFRLVQIKIQYKNGLKKSYFVTFRAYEKILFDIVYEFENREIMDTRINTSRR